MKEEALKTLWQNTHEQLNKSLQVQQQQAGGIARMKAVSLLGTMKPAKIFALIAGGLWVGIGTLLLANIYMHGFPTANKFFLFSATLQVALTAIALGIYIRQLVLLHRLDLAAPVLKTQERLASLVSTTLWIARVLFLQLPLWTTFYWNSAMFKQGNLGLWTLQVFVTMSFAVLALWLFIHIRYAYRDKKWFRLLFSGREWTPLLEALALLGTIKEYRDECKPL